MCAFAIERVVVCESDCACIRVFDMFVFVLDAVFVFMTVGEPFLWPHEGTLVTLFIIHVRPRGPQTAESRI